MGQHLGKIPLGASRSWNDNIRMYLGKYIVRVGSVVAQNRVRWRALVLAVFYYEKVSLLHSYCHN